MESSLSENISPALIKAIEKRAMLNLLYSIKYGLQFNEITLNEKFIDQQIRVVKEFGKPISYIDEKKLLNT